MRCISPGFTLLECSIYCVCCTLTFLFLLHSMVSIYTILKSTAQKTYILTELMSAQELLCTDLEQAPATGTLWKKKSMSEIVFTNSTGSTTVDIGWSLHNNTLVRTLGRFDTKTAQWHAKKQNTVARHIAQLIFTFYTHAGNIHGVSCTLIGKIVQKEYTSSRLAMLKNRTYTS